MTDTPSVARAAAGMGVATAASRAVGFVRILVVAAVLGTTYLGNAYQSSNSVSNVLFELLAAGALSAVLVPTFVHHLDREDQPEAERLAGRILGVALVARRVSVTCLRSCSGSSSRRCCCTRWVRSVSPCSTRSAGSR